MRREKRMSDTEFTTKCEILAELWMNYRDDEEFLDFVEYNDLGLPLAYMIANNIVTNNDLASKFVEEAFDLLLSALGIDEDTGFENLDELLGLDIIE